DIHRDERRDSAAARRRTIGGCHGGGFHPGAKSLAIALFSAHPSKGVAAGDKASGYIQFVGREGKARGGGDGCSFQRSAWCGDCSAVSSAPPSWRALQTHPPSPSRARRWCATPRPKR